MKSGTDSDACGDDGVIGFQNATGVRPCLLDLIDFPGLIDKAPVNLPLPSGKLYQIVGGSDGSTMIDHDCDRTVQFVLHSSGDHIKFERHDNCIPIGTRVPLILLIIVNPSGKITFSVVE